MWWKTKVQLQLNDWFLCDFSFLPWFEVFYNFLNHLAEVLNRSEKNVIEPLLRSAYVQEVPGAGIPVTVVAQQEVRGHRKS